jgi:hypothetical protein
MQDAAAKEQAMRDSVKAPEEPTVEASDPRVKTASSSGSHKLTATKIASRQRDTDSEPAPAPAKGGHNPDILARYEDGDVSAALDLARQDGDKDMIAKLQKFESAYEAAKNSLSAKDGTGAIRNFTAAEKADEALSKSGWGKYGAEVRKQLSALYTLVGLKHLENENSEDAQKAFALAVKFDPSNEKARQQLAKLGGSAQTAAAAPVAKKKIDDAWGDDDSQKDNAPPRRPAQLRRPAGSNSAASEKPSGRSAIDAAFGD